MAVDEMLLDGSATAAPFTLRFYTWRVPTVSLGYMQPWRQGVDAKLARRLGVDLVRRPTGGRAVLHSDELTYSLVGPSEHGPLAGGVVETYRRVAEGLCAGLRQLGADVDVVRPVGRGERRGRTGACFSSRSRYELTHHNRKLVGSAQRRSDGRVLQHGSMPLGRPAARFWRVLGDDGAEAALATASLQEVLRFRPSPRVLCSSLAHSISSTLDLPTRFGVLSAHERRAAAFLERRHANLAWVRRV
jgi:lipoate-protein ligase A